MSAPSIGDVFRVGVHILKTTVAEKTKRILAQIGSNVGQGQTDADNVEWWQHIGFASRPSDAVPGKDAAEGFSLRIGGYDVIVASQDKRGLELYGNLQPGETCLYAAGADGTGQARVLLKGDGGISLYTTKENTPGATGMGVFLNADGSISLLGPEGNAALLKSDGGIQIFNGSGGVQVLADGSVKISSGGQIVISGGAITLGGPAGLPLAIGPQVVAALTAIQTELTVHAAAWAALGALAGPVLGAMIAPIAAPIAGARVAGAVAFGTASPLIPTKRISGD